MNKRMFRIVSGHDQASSHPQKGECPASAPGGREASREGSNESFTGRVEGGVQFHLGVVDEGCALAAVVALRFGSCMVTIELEVLHTGLGMRSRAQG